MDKAIEVFKKGRIVIFPTDTVYGIGCRMDDEDVVEKVYKIRNRPSDKPLLILVDSIEMAEKYVEFTDPARSLVNKYWPGGVTMILPCKTDKVPYVVRVGGDSLAVRMPAHNEIRAVIREVGVPIVAPSANVSGDPTPYSLDQVNKQLLDQADYVMEGECVYKKESTIFDLTTNPWTIVRPGAVEVSI